MQVRRESRSGYISTKLNADGSIEPRPPPGTPRPRTNRSTKSNESSCNSYNVIQSNFEKPQSRTITTPIQAPLFPPTELLYMHGIANSISYRAHPVVGALRHLPMPQPPSHLAKRRHPSFTQK